MLSLYWFYLLLASVCEVFWTYFMKKADGMKNKIPFILFIVFNALSSLFLAFATKILPISIAYPIWTGAGAVGAVLVGIFIFKERSSFKKFFFLGLVLAGIIGLKTI